MLVAGRELGDLGLDQLLALRASDRWERLTLICGVTQQPPNRNIVLRVGLLTTLTKLPAALAALPARVNELLHPTAGKSIPIVVRPSAERCVDPIQQAQVVGREAMIDPGSPFGHDIAARQRDDRCPLGVLLCLSARRHVGPQPSG